MMISGTGSPFDGYPRTSYSSLQGRKHHGDILREAARLAEAGQLVPRLDPRHLTLTNVGEAYRAIKERSAQGKLVVDIESADQAPGS
jgi:NADPH:quinone reductase-like Zn-dependent oxidoreductase